MNNVYNSKMWVVFPCHTVVAPASLVVLSLSGLTMTKWSLVIPALTDLQSFPGDSLNNEGLVWRVFKNFIKLLKALYFQEGYRDKTSMKKKAHRRFRQYIVKSCPCWVKYEEYIKPVLQMCAKEKQCKSCPWMQGGKLPSMVIKEQNVLSSAGQSKHTVMSRKWPAHWPKTVLWLLVQRHMGVEFRSKQIYYVWV